MLILHPGTTSYRLATAITGLMETVPVGARMISGVTRRELIAGVAALFASATRGRGDAAPDVVQSVTGPIAADRLGITLMHEHVLVDFVGASEVNPSRYDPDQVFRVALPYFVKVRELGCESVLECTPAYIGRDVKLLQRLADASGLHILTNTGYYGAANDKYLPSYAFTETAEQLAARWIREAEHGIDGTPIKPGFMKIGVDEAPLSEVDTKLVRAASIAHRATGLPIASHTTTGAAAMAEIELLDRAGVSAGAFIWVHAHNERETSFHTRAAKAGAWVEFDGVAEDSISRHVELVRHMKTEGLLGRVLLSHDAGWYHVGEPNGGTYRAHDTLFTTFIPRLRARGFTEAEIRQLIIENPRRVLTPDP
jgi:phosphotriesterase-related protein